MPSEGAIASPPSGALRSISITDGSHQKELLFASKTGKYDTAQNGSCSGTRHGNSSSHRRRRGARINRLVEDTLSKGAKLLVGANTDGTTMPTPVLDHVTPDMAIDEFTKLKWLAIEPRNQPYPS